MSPATNDYMFRPAVRANIGLFIGLAGGTDSGKTWSAFEMAKGIVGPGNRFAVVDTENRRASHYAEFFNFDVFDLDAPYSAERYEGSVMAAVKAGYKAIVVDSATTEHDGVGGYLDSQAKDLEERVSRAKKKHPNASEWDLIDKLTPLSWTQPKAKRKRMMQTLLACSTSIPIIFCFRAEEKVFTSKDGKLVANNPPIWAPICGKGMPFEMTVFFMLHREHKGVPVPIKLQEQHRALFPLDKPLNEETGRAIAAWAHGQNTARAAPASAPQEAPEPARAGDSAPPPGETAVEFITPDQVANIETLCQDAKMSLDAFRRAAKVDSLQKMPVEDYEPAIAFLTKRIANAGASSRSTGGAR